MEITPGIVAKPLKKDDDAIEEMVEIHRKIALQKEQESSDREARIKAIYKDVESRIIERDGPIRITQEMHDLGIADKVWTMIQQAEMLGPLRRFFSEEDNEERDLGDPSNWLD